jgi:2-isopropylmalate synthase
MRTIAISDRTIKLSGGELALSFREKIELAKLLDKLEVPVIELHPIRSRKTDSLLVKSVAAAVKTSVVAVPVELTPDGVALVWNALREAKNPRLQVEAPVSPVQMEYLSHKKPEAMLAAIRETAAACRGLTADVEFVADDATRSDPAFLDEAVRAAVAAGVSTVTLCDTAGAMLPDEFAAFLTDILARVPELASVRLGVGCSDELSMADSCAVAAVRAGASEIKAAAYPCGVVSLQNAARILDAKGSSFDARCSVRMVQLGRVTGQIARLCQSGRSKTSALEGGIQEADNAFSLTARDSMADVVKAAERLGYDLSEEDALKVYEAFSRIAAKKDSVGSRELDAIVAAAAMQVPPAYQVQSYVINSGNVMSATAHLKITRQGETLEGVSVGDGPIDAAFLAIESILGRRCELDDFQIQAVTEGHQAMGQTVVKLRSGGKLYSGRGISTDIIGASILAYVNALNKIVYEEESV